MQHPDEGMIHTWLDGELPAEEATALEAHVVECELCKASVAEARGFIAASSRIIGALDNVPSGVIPVPKPVKGVWYSSPQFRAAAAVLVVAGASLLVMRTGTQKATLSDSSRPEASEAATMQRAMSGAAPAENVPTSIANSAAVKPPVVADQAAAKLEAATPRAEPAPSKASKVLSAPVSPVAANKIIAKEEDFSGKGLKGGTANGVAGPAAVQETAVLRGNVAGVAMKAADALSTRRDFREADAELKVLRVDSTATTKKTTYKSLSGAEVVLTEEPPAPVLSKVGASTDEVRRRAASGEAVVTNAPSAPAPAAQLVAPMQSITWVDPATQRRYSLSGRVSRQELEAIKARLLQAKH